MADNLNRKDELWSKCPAGAIQEVADTAVLNRPAAEANVDPAKRRFLLAASTAAGVAVLGGGAYLLTRPDDAKKGMTNGGSIVNANYGGISCREVAFLTEDYIDGKISDSKRLQQIDTHLAMCVKCREFYEQHGAVQG